LGDIPSGTGPERRLIDWLPLRLVSSSNGPRDDGHAEGEDRDRDEDLGEPRGA
jgi:hypothetical protein